MQSVGNWQFGTNICLIAIEEARDIAMHEITRMSKRSVLMLAIASAAAAGFAMDVTAAVLIGSNPSNPPGFDDLKNKLLYSIVEAHLASIPIFFLIPVAYRAIFSYFPSSWLREYLSDRPRPEVPPEVEPNPQDDPRSLMASYCATAARMAERIYHRSGVYLWGGLIIAGFGLLVFFQRSRELQVIPPGSGAGDYVRYLVSLTPSVGILFFIELVAFYFLRQHRSSMDEYRYFDLIRRTREENLVILNMFRENTHETSTKDVLSAMNVYSHSSKLGKDETTEILEARRLQKDEMAIFEKLVDAVSKFKETVSFKKESERK